MYGKREAIMTRGFAILSMIVLHLFCRKGADVFGTPLIWLNDSTPLVYLFGFFSEICVPIYTLCAGYALMLKYNEGGYTYRGNLKRVLRLLTNYWIILVLFCILGLLLPSDGSMPGSVTKFLKSIVLLDSYNGAWWYLNTYVILMLIPAPVLLFPVKKLKPWIGFVGCLILQVGWYFLDRYSLFSPIPNVPMLQFIWKEAYNLINVLPSFWIGVFLYQSDAITKLNNLFVKYVPKYRNVMLAGAFVAMFALVNVLEKSVLMPTVGVITFLMFNLWQKGKASTAVFAFLGKHSTNIWLTHMFFYLCVFPGLVQAAKYPVLMLLFMLVLCVGISYVIMGIQKGINYLVLSIKR